MAIAELFNEAEKAAAEVKDAKLAMESADKAAEVARKAYADAVNKLQDTRVKIDEALGGIINVGGNSSVRQYS